MTVREHLHDSIQSTVSLDEELPEGTVLKGWVLVAEWVDPKGSGWLTRLSGGPGTIGDDCDLPDWQQQGYLHNALNGDLLRFGMEDEDE